MSVIVQPPRIYLVSQTGHEEKLFCDDGSQRAYRNVAKNSVFSLVIGQNTKETPLIDFSNVGVICSLVYDQNREKPVEIISQKPMEYKINPVQNKNEIRVDARIKVLSSQFGGSLFCILVQIVDNNKNAIPSLSVYSHPIRVRSKLRSSLPAVSVPKGNALQTPSSPSPVSAMKRPMVEPFVGMSPVKRGRQMTKESSRDACSPIVKSEFVDEDQNDTSRILEALSRIEARQMQQQALMEQFAMNKNSSCGSPEAVPNAVNSVSSSVLPPFPPMADTQCYPCVHAPEREASLSFSEKFLNLMVMFSQMSENEKQEQLCFIQNYANQKEQHAMYTLFNSLSSSSSSSPQQDVQPVTSDSDTPSSTYDEEYPAYTLF